MCIADAMVSIFNVAPNLCVITNYPAACPFQSNSISCKITNFLSITSIYGSTYVLVMTSLDRFLAICYPLVAQRFTKRHVHISCLFAWCLSIAFSTPQLSIFYFNKTTDNCAASWSDVKHKHVKYENSYTVWFATAIWILPCIIITVCYISITSVIWKRPAYIRKNTRTRHGFTSERGRTNILMKPVLLTFAVVIGYVLCWSPWMITTLITQLNSEFLNKRARAKTETVSMLTYLIGFNSCLNPFIYLGFNWRSIFVKSKGREATSIVMSLSHYNSTQQRKAAHTEAEELDNLYPCSGEESKEECLHTTSDSMLNLPK
ncbi:hypothetical protein EB796_011293 [Bugula neritina]|uniref:G-protein coupled receptors family 1 profile domain-containing protein n=1 Tax=Bugula neritina TaxID=10212 RepID=A0A7J7JVJ4_BUGNE|nr:hypothetical protein EB796_011293 [Bugula neritina]